MPEKGLEDASIPDLDYYHITHEPPPSHPPPSSSAFEKAEMGAPRALGTEYAPGSAREHLAAEVKGET